MVQCKVIPFIIWKTINLLWMFHLSIYLVNLAGYIVRLNFIGANLIFKLCSHEYAYFILLSQQHMKQNRKSASPTSQLQILYKKNKQNNKKTEEIIYLNSKYTEKSPHKQEAVKQINSIIKHLTSRICDQGQRPNESPKNTLLTRPIDSHRHKIHQHKTERCKMAKKEAKEKIIRQTTKSQKEGSSKRTLKKTILSEQYILVDGKFKNIKSEEVQKLMQSMSKRTFLERHSKKIELQSQVSPQIHNQSHINHNQTADNSKAIPNIQKQIIKIQRWWRKILAKRQQQDKQQQQASLIELLSDCPIPISNQLEQRYQASKIQYQTHNALLDRLRDMNKIQPLIYLEKKAVISSIYKRQLAETEEIRLILQNNQHKVEDIKQSINRHIELIKNLEAMDQSQIQALFPISQGRSVIKEQPCKQINQNVVNALHGISDHYPKKCYESERVITQQQEIQFYGQMPEINNYSQILGQLRIENEIKEQIQLRIARQMGNSFGSEHLLQYNQSAIDTSLPSIHKFLFTFFQSYINQQQEAFLRSINMPFGHSLLRRLRQMREPEDDQMQIYQDEQGIEYGLKYVLSDDIFERLYPTTLKKDKINQDSMQRQYSKIHNKAVFDCFNCLLNQFRPYYAVDGPPFHWNTSEKALTYYFIDEDNINEVFEKTMTKVLLKASSLCGLIVNKGQVEVDSFQDQDGNQQKRFCHEILHQARQQSLYKSEKKEMAEYCKQLITSQTIDTRLLLEISSHILGRILTELILEIQNI